jgi:hypothetical protein
MRERPSTSERGDHSRTIGQRGEENHGLNPRPAENCSAAALEPSMRTQSAIGCPRHADTKLRPQAEDGEQELRCESLSETAGPRNSTAHCFHSPDNRRGAHARIHHVHSSHRGNTTDAANDDAGRKHPQRESHRDNERQRDDRERVLSTRDAKESTKGHRSIPGVDSRAWNPRLTITEVPQW